MASPSSQSTSGTPPGAPPRVLPRVLQHRLARREDEEDEAEDERQVDAAMRRLAQQAETRGVVVEARQHDQQRADHEGRGRHERPEPHLGIVFLLELDRLRGVDFLHAEPSGVPCVHACAPRRANETGPVGRPRCDPFVGDARRRLLQHALFLVELLGARMERDAGARRRLRRPIALPLAWPASSCLRVLSFHIALVTS